ncbi:MAG: phenylalanine--tRNA ligase subunit alpha [Deltaproteobacteria bacterium]|nr:phenylalanine--tRNA ligase subunit alpha [Deltaproteobacteria bacterium]
MSLLETLKQWEGDFQTEVAQVQKNPEAEVVEQLRVRWLGRKGKVSTLYEQLKELGGEERPKVGKKINDLRTSVETSLERLKSISLQHAIDAKLTDRKLDTSLPVSRNFMGGSLHPVTLIRTQFLKEFRRYGFSVWEGPELEFDFYNFGALNFPDDHPSRDMQDTFFVADRQKLVLRTHTSNIQIHAMLQNPPPIRFIAPGRVYRCDNDLTHSPMFHQLEGVLVDRGVSFAHLKGMIDAIVKALFGHDVKTRFRPSFFPFVEPGAEVDMLCTLCRGKGCRVCSQTGWLEIMGCGMVHPNVFENVNYDSEAYTGFAFGMGLDRMAMLAFGIDDLRLMFEGDEQFHNCFPVYPAR